MDAFTDADSRLFLNKEWLVKIDNATSRPYLFKFHSSQDSLRSCFLITDTKAVWFEAINSKQFARRWRQLNHGQAFEADDKEHAWRLKTLDLLCSMHTLKSVQESVFSFEDSRDADIALELQTLEHRWRWDANALSPNASAEILSGQLILPLISLTHLAFSSADPVSELAPHDLEQAVDKVARTGRRSQDVHVRQTLSRPRVATSLRRMTAMFNFAEPIPPILSTLEDEDVDMASSSAAPATINPHSQALSSVRTPSPTPTPPPHIRFSYRFHISMPSQQPPDPPTYLDNPGPPVADPTPSSDSKPPSSPGPKLKRTSSDTPHKAGEDSATEPESDGDGPVPITRAPSAGVHSSSSPPPRPSKKAKAVPEDSSADDEEQRKKAASARPAAGRPGVGVRQPIKRGGRRF